VRPCVNTRSVFRLEVRVVTFSVKWLFRASKTNIFLQKSTWSVVPELSLPCNYKFCQPPFHVIFKCNSIGSFLFKRFLLQIMNSVTFFLSARTESITVILPSCHYPRFLLFLSTNLDLFAVIVVLVTICKKKCGFLSAVPNSPNAHLYFHCRLIMCCWFAINISC
jgi:hypothetical protein